MSIQGPGSTTCSSRKHEYNECMRALWHILVSTRTSVRRFGNWAEQRLAYAILFPTLLAAYADRDHFHSYPYLPNDGPFFHIHWQVYGVLK